MVAVVDRDEALKLVERVPSGNLTVKNITRRIEKDLSDEDDSKEGEGTPEQVDTLTGK